MSHCSSSSAPGCVGGIRPAAKSEKERGWHTLEVRAKYAGEVYCTFVESREKGQIRTRVSTVSTSPITLTGSVATISNAKFFGSGGGDPPLNTRRCWVVFGGGALSAPLACLRRALGGMNGARTGSVLCTDSGRRGGDFVGEEGALDPARFPAVSHSRRHSVASPLLSETRLL